MIKRANDESVLVLQIDCSAWCSWSCRTSRRPRRGGSGALPRMSSVTWASVS